ncbi:pyroglutamyl-peptidase I, partial [Staphylococcus xylosus]|nr:pyroglutamyl-peptidase I [Staphylococcus xylosus]
MRILITGFDPFGGEEINPALEAVKLLPDNIEEHTIDKLEIPT